MIDATFQVADVSEMNEAFLDKIRSVVNGSEVDIFVHIVSKKPSLEELEARLLPNERRIWEGLKVGLEWAKQYEKGEVSDADLMTLSEFLDSMENEQEEEFEEQLEEQTTLA